MKFKLLSILLIVIPLGLFAQTDTSLHTFIYNGLVNHINFFQHENADYIRSFDKQSILQTLDYLSNYDTDSVIYNNSEGVAYILYHILSHDDKEIRKKALNLCLDFYRLGFAGSLFPIQQSDMDDTIKAKILYLMANKPYNEKELKVLTTKRLQYFKTLYTDDFLLRFERIDTSVISLSCARDSFIMNDMQEFSESLKQPVCYGFEELSELCAWLYIYEAIPSMGEYVKQYPDDERIVTHLARLGVTKYEDEIIENSLKETFIDNYALAFINTRKCFETIIHGLRIEGREHGDFSYYNKRRKIVSIECDGAYYKLANLRDLLSRSYFTMEIPFEGTIFFDVEDSTLLPKCEEVAKWMEDNIDKLEVNPNLRF
ncbi:MAG: hypothetical protein IKQ70_03660 [Bacteroidales bacterium]|nr:hypothetical protein [Bacteroidales bacterium]